MLLKLLSKLLSYVDPVGYRFCSWGTDLILAALLVWSVSFLKYNNGIS